MSTPVEGGADRPTRAIAVGAAFAAELVGTFILTYSGTAAILATSSLGHDTTFSVADDALVGLAFALGIVAAVYTVAKISGAHINPAVTIALAVVGKFPWRLVPVYLAAQFIGGILAGLMNWLMFGSSARAMLLGGTKPGTGVSWWAALVTEIVITLILLVVVMATAVFERAPGAGLAAGLAIGFWVGAAVFLALPVSGASLNPARTLGPDIVAGSFPSWWVYLAGPIIGGILGAVLWRFVISRGHEGVVEAMGDGQD